MPKKKEVSAGEAPKKVEVNADALDRLVKDNEAFRERITTLEAVADKSRLAWYEGTNPKKRPLTRVSLGLYPTDKGDKIIVGWTSMPINEMFQDSNSVWHERQTMELIFEDGSHLQVNYIDFVRRKQRLACEVVSKSRNEETGNETLKLVTVGEPKKTLEVDTVFVNI